MIWTKTGNIAAMVGSLIAVLALLYQLKTANDHSESGSLERWQQTVVFSIISDAGVLGENFDDIKTKYLQKVLQRFKNELDSSDVLQDSTLTLILLKLRSSNLVYKSIDEKYKERLVRDEVAVEENGEYLLRRKLTNTLMKKMSTSSCDISVENLEKHLLSEVKSELKDVNMTISRAIGSRYVTVNEEDMLCLLQDHDPQQIMQKKFNEQYSIQEKVQADFIAKQSKTFTELHEKLEKDAYKLMIQRVNEIGDKIQETVEK
jgi:uncharacterized protein (DUF2249 family)